MPYEWLQVIEGADSALPMGNAPLARLDMSTRTIEFDEDVILKARSGKSIGVAVAQGEYGPTSGTTGTGAGTWATPGALYFDNVNMVLYVNEGTLASPYWTPTSFDQRGLIGVFTDFRDGAGKAIANTDASATVPGSGLRVFGQGIAETDSGLTVAYAEGEPVASLIATNEDAHLAALGVGASGFLLQPDTQGPLVIDVDVAMSSAITTRAMFAGFLGAAADALDPAFTYATTVITMPLDDCAGVTYSSELTDADRLYAPHNKSNEAASLDAAVATDIDTGVDFPAAGTYCRLRVEINRGGDMRVFKNKAQVALIVDALDADEEAAPVCYVESTDANTKTMLVKHFAAWGSRGAA